MYIDWCVLCFQFRAKINTTSLSDAKWTGTGTAYYYKMHGTKCHKYTANHDQLIQINFIVSILELTSLSPEQL